MTGFVSMGAWGRADRRDDGSWEPDTGEVTRAGTELRGKSKH